MRGGIGFTVGEEGGEVECHRSAAGSRTVMSEELHKHNGQRPDIHESADLGVGIEGIESDQTYTNVQTWVGIEMWGVGFANWGTEVRGSRYLNRHL